MSCVAGEGLTSEASLTAVLTQSATWKIKVSHCDSFIDKFKTNSTIEIQPYHDSGLDSDTLVQKLL